MTFPLDIHIFGTTIPVHTIFELLSFFIGYRFFIFLRGKKKSDLLSPHAEWWLIVGMALGAFVGSRFIAALENPFLFMHPPTLMYYISGHTIAGGIIGGILGVEIAKKILKVQRKTGDLFVYPLMLGILIGRIGCFLTGVKDGTVGLASQLPWAFDQGDGIARHPTSLYEMAVIAAIWVIVKKFEKRGVLKQGDLFYIFVFCYFLFRFLVEFIKPRNTLWIELSSIQLLAGVVLIYYALYFIRRYKKSANE
jgi:prolipoprotein diacylglyceryltransferase